MGALKAMKDIGEAMIGLRDAAAFRERQIEFQGKIIEAQDGIFASARALVVGGKDKGARSRNR